MGMTPAQIGHSLAGVFGPAWQPETYAALLDRFGLDPKQKMKEFSRGMRMKLNLAAALAHAPELLVLDEPTAGLDPVMRGELLDLFLDYIQDENHSILLSSHITTDLEQAADSIAYIHKASCCSRRTRTCFCRNTACCAAAKPTCRARAGGRGGVHPPRAAGLREPGQRAGSRARRAAKRRVRPGQDRRHHALLCGEGPRMIGLLRKDQTLLWSSYGKNFLLVGALYTIMSCLSDSMVFVLYALVFLGGMYAVSTLSMDEQSQWDAYVRTLPVTPGQIVGSKYLLTLGWCALCFALAAAVWVIKTAVLGTLAQSWAATLAGCLSALLVVLLYCALTLPLSYKLGAAKARSATMVLLTLLMAGFILAGIALSSGNGTLPSMAENLAAINDVQVVGVLALLCLGALALFAASWAVSVGIYRRREG